MKINATIALYSDTCNFNMLSKIGIKKKCNNSYIEVEVCDVKEPQLPSTNVKYSELENTIINNIIHIFKNSKSNRMSFYGLFYMLGKKIKVEESKYSEVLNLMHDNSYLHIDCKTNNIYINTRVLKDIPFS